MIKFQRAFIDRDTISANVAEIDNILSILSSYCEFRMDINKKMGVSIPRIVQLCEKYKFSIRESDLFHLMTVCQGSNDPHVLNTLIEEDYIRRVTAFQRLGQMSEVDIDLFCDTERQHMKESLVLVDEENGSQFNLRIQRVAVQILYGRKVIATNHIQNQHFGRFLNQF
jgi:hypothetical protein